MDKIEQQNQEEIDREILSYVRGMQSLAPVVADSICAYLHRRAHRNCTPMQVRDRIAYLVSAGCLDEKKEWDGGEVIRYEITAKGMDLMDGKIPPLNWKP